MNDNYVVCDYMFVSTWKGIKKVEIDKILYVEANEKHCKIQLITGEAIECVSLLHQLLKLLPIDQFFLVHRRYAANLACVEEYNSQRSEVWLQNNQKLPLARRRKIEFISCWIRFYKTRSGQKLKE